MRVRSALLTVALGAAAAVSALHLLGAPNDLDSYGDRAASTAETVRSQVGSARIWVRSRGRDKVLNASAEVGLREAERDASSALSAFEALEPPRGALAARRRLAMLGAAAVDDLEALRIAAEQGRWEDLPRLATSLPDHARRLERFEEGVKQ